MMRLSDEQWALLKQMLQGAVLKIHRDIDGGKRYLVHPLNGEPIPIAPQVVSRLKRMDLIRSNQKFPASTYLLTEKALNALNSVQQNESTPVSPRGFSDD